MELALLRAEDRKRNFVGIKEIEFDNKKQRMMQAKAFGRKVGAFKEYNSLPCLVYRGMTCKKDGTPRKNPKRCSIYQCNLLRVNGEPVKNHGYGE